MTKTAQGAARGVVRTLAHPLVAVPGSYKVDLAQSSSRVEPAGKEEHPPFDHDRGFILGQPFAGNGLGKYMYVPFIGAMMGSAHAIHLFHRFTYIV